MKIKRILSLALAVLLVSPTNILGANYNFSTSYEREKFGSSTESTKMPDYSSIENIRKNKDVAYYPPQYGVFSGVIPTKNTNPYVEDEYGLSSVSGLVDYGTYNNGEYSIDAGSTGFLTSTSTLNPTSSGNMSGSGSTSANTTIVSSELPPPSSENNVTISYSETEYIETSNITEVQKDSSGNIGTIKIPKLNLTKAIRETVSLEVMKNYIGHFEHTSQWDGNVGLASHNQGSSAFFRGIWNLTNGDEIIYTTSVGTRTYLVYNKVKVNEYDFSLLTATDENIITLSTCVEGQSELRWIIQARQR